MTTTRDLLHDAWALIANANGGDWAGADPEWRAAAERWRDRWHETMPSSPRIDAAVELSRLHPTTEMPLLIEYVDKVIEVVAAHVRALEAPESHAHYASGWECGRDDVLDLLEGGR